MRQLTHSKLILIAATCCIGKAIAEPETNFEQVGESVRLSWKPQPDIGHDVEKSFDLIDWRKEPAFPAVAEEDGRYSISIPITSGDRAFLRLREREPDVFAIPQAPTADGKPAIISMIDQGKVRRFLLWLPPGYTPPTAGAASCDNGHALAIICHGAGQDGPSFASRHPDLISKCAAEGVILAVPSGTVTPGFGKRSWNIFEERHRPDDAVFIVQLVELLRQELWIDRDRVYIGGFSNGGTFSQRAVARAPGTFAAFGAVAAAHGTQTGTGANDPVVRTPAPFDPSSAPAIIVSGHQDTTNPFDGGPSEGGQLKTPARDMPTFWMESLGCDEVPTVTPIPTPPAAPMPFGNIETSCAGTQKEVTFIDLNRLDHSWPDDDDMMGFDANRGVIDFFLAHRRGAIEDLADPAPVTAPSSWTRLVFEGRDAIYQVPDAPIGMVFVAHGAGGDASFIDNVEMVEILTGLDAEGFGFFALSSEDRAAGNWDLADVGAASNADAQRLLNLHAEIIASTAITAATPVIMLGFGEGGHFSLVAGQALDATDFDVEGVALLNTPLQEPLPAQVATAMNLLEEPVFVATAENDALAPPVPAWSFHRRVALTGTPQQMGTTNCFVGRRKRLTEARITRVDGLGAGVFNAVRQELFNAGLIDANADPAVCPDDFDCETIPLPAGLSAAQEAQLRLQLCVVLAGHSVDAGCLPRLRDFCIQARSNDERPVIPPPASAAADPSPIAPVPDVPWTQSATFQGFPVRAYIPPSPDGLVFFFHGTTGDIGFFNRLEQREMIHALFAANIGVIGTVSTDRDNNKVPGARWDSRSLDPDTDAPFFDNVDWVRLMALRDSLIASTGVTADTPLFSMGFSNGGGFALTFAHLAQQAGLDFRGAAIHAQAASKSGAFRAARRLLAGTPLFLTVLANDGAAINMPALAGMLEAQGHSVTFLPGEELRLSPERFLRMPGTSQADANALFDGFLAGGVIDATGLRQFDVGAKVGTPNDEVERQLRATIISDHVYSARFLAEEIAFFEALVP